MIDVYFYFYFWLFITLLIDLEVFAEPHSLAPSFPLQFFYCHCDYFDVVVVVVLFICGGVFLLFSSRMIIKRKKKNIINLEYDILY
jgi:hypothetical protein